MFKGVVTWACSAISEQGPDWVSRNGRQQEFPDRAIPRVRQEWPHAAGAPIHSELTLPEFLEPGRGLETLQGEVGSIHSGDRDASQEAEIWDPSSTGKE